MDKLEKTKYKIIAPKDGECPLTLSALITLTDSALTKHDARIANMEENERYALLKNWTPEQIAEIRAQGRIPYSFALALTKINPVSSLQRTLKTSVVAKAKVNKDNDPMAALTTIALRDVADNSNYYHVENEWFDDGIYVGPGCAEVYVDYSGYTPEVRIRNVDYKDIIWDGNSINYLMDDGLFVSKMEKRYRFELEKRFDVNLMDNVAAGTNTSWIGREKESYYIGRQNTPGKEPSANNPTDIITMFTHYQRVNRDYWCVVFKDSQDIWSKDVTVKKFRKKSDAEEELRRLNLPYITQGLPNEGTIEKKTEVRIDKYEFCYNKILTYEETDMETFPFSFFFPLFRKGNFISLMDIFKAPQQWTDRILSQIDYSFGRNLKNVIEGNAAALAETETPESAEAKTEHGGIIWRNGTEQVFREIASPGVNPQYAQMFDILKGLVEDFGGGRSFQGLSEGANESGVAVQKKANQGQILNQIYLDNFKMSKKHLFEIVCWFIKKYDNEERMIDVFGSELSPEMLELLTQNGIYSPSSNYDGYVTVNQEGNELSFLSGADYKLQISEDQFSETAREKNMMTSLSAVKMFPWLQETPTFIENALISLGYSATDAKRYMMERDQLMQQQAQAQQQQAAQEQASKNNSEKTKTNLELLKLLMDNKEDKSEKEKKD